MAQITDEQFQKVVSGIEEKEFSTADFIEALKLNYPEDWHRLEKRYGQGGEGASRYYTANSYVSQFLNGLARHERLFKLDYRAAPEGWGSPIIRYWSTDKKSSSHHYNQQAKEGEDGVPELPPTQLFYHPILASLSDFEEPQPRNEVQDDVADRLGLTVEQRQQLANDLSPSHEYRSGWSLSVLKKAGLLDNPASGYWQITDSGRLLISRYPVQLPSEEIEKINAIWWKKRVSVDTDIVAGAAQGRGLGPDERKAVEMHAMRAVETYLAANGWEFEDTSSNQPFDFKASKDGREVIVEVKGTTGLADSILLTANEVEAQRLKYPDTVLFVLHSIKLDRTSSPPVATGGVELVELDWKLEDEALQATAYSYSLKKAASGKS